jgi:serine/threonine protein kinase
VRTIRKIGRYELVREIGRGGTALVYLARQADLDRMVALKELGAFHLHDPSFGERFVRESRLIASLSHPNILTVFEFFEHDGTPYIAMEYVERGSLRPFIGYLTLAQIGGVMEGVLAALSHAEASSIVHRDLKPENVMVTAEGRVKIADFGLAKVTSDVAVTGAFVTATGTTVGTPAYMAPEQAMARPVGPWTDLYSVGCMAFEMLSGRVPFADSDAPMVILMRHVNEPIPPLSSIDTKIDERLSGWVERLLAKDPTQRTQSAPDAWESLEEILIALLGPRWRRDARLSGSPPTASVAGLPAAVDAAKDHGPLHESLPLTPAPFESLVLGDRDSAPPETAAPSPVPEAGETTDTGFVTFGPLHSLPAVPAAAADPGPEARAGPPPRLDPVSSVAGPAALPSPLGAGPFEASLVASFRYLHGPLIKDEGGVPLLGNQGVVEALKDRLQHSHGGTFLITGFRGVGKTTVVLRAVEEVQRTSEGSLDYLSVVLSVARPMSVDQLLFEVVRRLFEALTDHGVLGTLEPETRQALFLAYARTSLAFKETSSRARESSQSLNLDFGRMGSAGAGLAVSTPKIGVSRKRIDSMAREASFLAYSQSDVEHDFLRIIDLLNNPAMPTRKSWRIRRMPSRRWRGRVVVVLDELDKLSCTPEGMECIDDLLMGLKNILTAPNVHFIFVGGPELHDSFLRDSARGNSVYESVFAHHLYVPCVWNASRDLLGAVVDPTGTPEDSSYLAQLQSYFDFKSRGLPRLLLREINGLVSWRNDRAVIEIGEIDAARIGFYSYLQAVVDEFVTTGVDQELLALPIDEDRWRLGAYYITDWVLGRGNAAFSVDEILSDEATPSPLMKASIKRIERLVVHLCRRHILEELWTPEAGRTVVGDVKQVTVYRLAPEVVARLSEFARRNERDRVGLGRVSSLDGRSGESPPGQAPASGVSGAGVCTLDNGRYEVAELVAVGALGRVYRAEDRRLGREVAIKVPAPNMLRDEYSRGRWRREAEIAVRLKHPHIVTTYDVFVDDDSVGIVMELINGPSLRESLPLEPPSALAVTVRLLDALAYGRDAGLARFDIKPENVLFHNSTRPVIVDIGLVKPVQNSPGGFATMNVGDGAHQALLGTPAYMSPEQALGTPLDIRSDLYSMALVICEMIAGRPLRDLSQPQDEVLRQAASGLVDLATFEASPALREALTRALALDRDERFPSPEAMREALLATAEGAASALLAETELLLPANRPKGGRQLEAIAQT